MSVKDQPNGSGVCNVSTFLTCVRYAALVVAVGTQREPPFMNDVPLTPSTARAPKMAAQVQGCDDPHWSTQNTDSTCSKWSVSPKLLLKGSKKSHSFCVLSLIKATDRILKRCWIIIILRLVQ